MKILFLCSSNIFRSQIAEAFFNKLSNKYRVQSAALISPQDKMHLFVIKAMKEEGIDISNNKSKKVSEEMLKEADIIILMSENLRPLLNNYNSSLKKSVKIEAWDIPDIISAENQ